MTKDVRQSGESRGVLRPEQVIGQPAGQNATWGSVGFHTLPAGERSLAAFGAALALTLAVSALAPALLGVGPAAAGVAVAAGAGLATLVWLLPRPGVSRKAPVSALRAPLVVAAAVFSLAAVLGVPLLVSQTLPPYAVGPAEEALFDGSSAPAFVEQESYAASLRLSADAQQAAGMPAQLIPRLVLSPAGQPVPALQVFWRVLDGVDGASLSSGRFPLQPSAGPRAIIFSDAASAGGGSYRGCPALKVTLRAPGAPDRDLSVLLPCR